MIPLFLRSVAAQVRALVESKRAVHVTEADAVELEMIAGLPWEKCFKSMPPEPGPISLDTALEEQVTPADIALGWLRSARLEHAEYFSGFGDPYAQRAGVCAELAVIAAGTWTPDGLDETKVSAHSGALDGARAAWEAVVGECERAIDPTKLASIREGKAGYCHPLNEVMDKHRRELEAMK